MALGADRQSSRAVPVRSATVAFFRRPCTWQPTSPCLQTGDHDVRGEQPQLVREPPTDSWPNRQWPARLHHAQCAPVQPRSVSFEALVAARP